MQRFATGDTALTFLSVNKEALLLRAGSRTPEGERFVAVRFATDESARLFARETLKGGMDLDHAILRVDPKSAFGLTLPEGRMHQVDVMGLPSDPSLLPAVVLVTSPTGVQVKETLEAVVRSLSSPAKDVAAADARAPGPAPEAPVAAEAVQAEQVPEIALAREPAPAPKPAKEAAAPAEVEPPVEEKAPAPAEQPAAAQVKTLPHPPAELPNPSGKRPLVKDVDVVSWPSIKDDTLKVRINEFTSGRFYVDFRRWYTKDGQSLPSNKGIRIKASELANLRESIVMVEAMIADIVKDDPSAS